MKTGLSCHNNCFCFFGDWWDLARFEADRLKLRPLLKVDVRMSLPIGMQVSAQEIRKRR